MLDIALFAEIDENKWALLHWFWFILPACQHDDGNIEDMLEIKVHTDERTQVHSARSSLAVIHPSTNAT